MQQYVLAIAKSFVSKCRETGDDRLLPILKCLVSFFESQATVVAGYTLDGLPLENYTHTCFQAPVWCLFSVRSSTQVAFLCCINVCIMLHCPKNFAECESPKWITPPKCDPSCVQIMKSPQVAKMEREMALTTPDVYFGTELLAHVQLAQQLTPAIAQRC